MNTDIYCEIDQNIADEICRRRPEIKGMKELAKWLHKTRKWREKCQKRMLEKPWSAKRDVYIARVK